MKKYYHSCTGELQTKPPLRAISGGFITDINKLKRRLQVMPQISHDNMKGKSPSKLIQQGIDQSWNQQNQSSTTAQEALNKAYNKAPKPPGETKTTK